MITFLSGTWVPFLDDGSVLRSFLFDDGAMGIMISAMAAMIGAHGYTSSHGTQHAARIIREAGAARANPAAATKVEPNAEPSLPVP